MMPSEALINVIINGGAFALAVVLIFYTLRQNERREERLLAIIEKHSAKLEEISHILSDIQKQLTKPLK